ncbi:hypothetical protein BC938DRAFT_472315 [Jimgerdemannia flammicorona]|uniref:Uncharacterized protein n=1 Tax=Jimgerdemannia flammicorona TaxID=994334 RepID=A0A433QU44_9FUNG|nr:hypothetical protein BC938DRAFT_472315 [Jimgerdemannia flammicorona]
MIESGFTTRVNSERDVDINFNVHLYKCIYNIVDMHYSLFLPYLPVGKLNVGHPGLEEHLHYRRLV